MVLPICMNYAYIHSTVFPSLLPAVDWFWFGPESDWWKEPPARLQSCPCQVGKSLVGHRRDTRFRCWWSQVDVEGLSGLSVRETLCLARTFGLVVVDTPYAPGKSTEPIRSQTSSRKWRTALRLPRRPPEAGVGGGHALAGYQYQYHAAWELERAMAELDLSAAEMLNLVLQVTMMFLQSAVEAWHIELVIRKKKKSCNHFTM